ncbi:MAG: maleylpyruvate isomerase family mycothiol-dependent enzyme [Chloroflexota bacterium]
MDKASYLSAFSRDVEATVAAARQGLDVPVRSCPAWNLGGMIGHLGLSYTHWNKRVLAGHAKKVTFEPEDFASFPGYWEWAQRDYAPDKLPPGLLEWFEHAARTLHATLQAADPEGKVGTWYPPDQTAGFVQRRMAHETSIHRWDAQWAHGVDAPIDMELARDGIDEVLDVFVESRRKWEKPGPSNNETFHFHCTDCEGEWFVRFDSDGPHITREHAKGDVALRGTASDLLLWHWQRLPADRLEVLGDPTMVERWFELVPPN